MLVLPVLKLPVRRLQTSWKDYRWLKKIDSSILRKAEYLPWVTRVRVRAGLFAGTFPVLLKAGVFSKTIPKTLPGVDFVPCQRSRQIYAPFIIFLNILVASRTEELF